MLRESGNQLLDTLANSISASFDNTLGISDMNQEGTNVYLNAHEYTLSSNHHNTRQPSLVLTFIKLLNTLWCGKVFSNFLRYAGKLPFLFCELPCAKSTCRRDAPQKITATFNIKFGALYD